MAMTAGTADIATTGIAVMAMVMVTTPAKLDTLMFKGLEGGRGLVIIPVIKSWPAVT